LTSIDKTLVLQEAKSNLWNDLVEVKAKLPIDFQYSFPDGGESKQSKLLFE